MGTTDPEVHHAAPGCLISLHEKANGISLDSEGIQAWLEWEWEAMRWCVPVEISRDDLEALVERSALLLERDKHRLIHEGDWRRWGARGGRETLKRYGPGWFSPLARRRWGRIGPEELEAAGVTQLGAPRREALRLPARTSLQSPQGSSSRRGGNDEGASLPRKGCGHSWGLESPWEERWAPLRLTELIPAMEIRGHEPAPIREMDWRLGF
jgi:hypothetical protein